MIFLAFRQLISRRRQTILTLAGIILGTVAFIVISGIMLGFREFFIDQLVNNDAQVHITSKETILDTKTLSTFFFPSLVIQQLYYKIRLTPVPEQSSVRGLTGSELCSTTC